MKPLILLWLLFVLTSAVSLADSLEVVVLDVGEGQAVLLKRENRGILIDTGHAGVARSVLDKLHRYSVDQLDCLIFTHLHPDHASGYFRIREAFPQAVIYDNGDPAAVKSSIDMVRWTATALNGDRHRKVLDADARIEWMDLDISLLWPQRLEGDDLNRNSLVLSIRYCSATLLLMGDVDSHVERALLDAGSLAGELDLLVVGHHASLHSSHSEFLEAINPKNCAVSVNRANIRGYPEVTTLQRLKDSCGHVYRTDRDGDIQLTWQGGKLGKDKCGTSE